MRYKNRIRNFTDSYPKMYPGHQCRNITFIVTHSCNLQCTYCYEHNKSDAKMSLATAKACVDMLFREDLRNSDYINAEITHGLVMDFIGGEPLLEIDLIDQTVDYFREKAMALGHRWATQYMVSMSSNGMLYFDPRVQAFLEKNRGRVSISITVDGDKETHDACRLDCNGCGSYDKAAAAFADVLEKYNQHGTKFTVAPGNVERVFHACRDIIEKNDLSSMHCNCVYEEGWDNSHAKIFYEQLKMLADWAIDTGRYKRLVLSIFDESIGKAQGERDTQNWCGGTGKMLAFDVDGTVYPCTRYSPVSMGNAQKLLRIGDVKKGIGVLPEDEKTVAMLNAITRQSQSTETCVGCPISTGCGWCSAYNYEITGTPNKRLTFICPMHKARVMAASYYHNKIHGLDENYPPFALHIPAEWALEIVDNKEYAMLVALDKSSTNQGGTP